MSEVIKAYGLTFGIEDFSEESLIKSHSFLRDEFKKSNEVRNDEYRDGYEAGKLQGFVFISELEYISIAKLKSMTVQELANMLEDCT